MARGQRGRRGFAALAALLAVLLGPRAVAAADPARAAEAPLAVVTDVEGGARVHRAGRTHAVAALDLLERSDQIWLEPRAHVELVFFHGNGRVYSLSGPGRFALRVDEAVGLEAGARVAVRELAPAWRSLRIAPGAIGRASVALRGAPGDRLELQSPVGAQLDEALAQLRWESPYGPHPQSWAYAVRVIDAGGAMVFSTSTRDTVVMLPQQLPWVREQTYLWTVEARAEDGRHASAAAEFRILDPVTQEQIRTLRRAVEQARVDHQQGGATAEDVLLAMAFAQAGLREEADRAWHALALVRPAFAYLISPGQ